MIPGPWPAIFAAAFGLFGVVLIAVPLGLVARTKRPVREVSGLLLSGCGFLLLAAGVYYLERGAGPLVVIGVMVSVAGNLLQRGVTER